MRTIRDGVQQSCPRFLLQRRIDLNDKNTKRGCSPFWAASTFLFTLEDCPHFIAFWALPHYGQGMAWCGRIYLEGMGQSRNQKSGMSPEVGQWSGGSRRATLQELGDNWNKLAPHSLLIHSTNIYWEITMYQTLGQVVGTPWWVSPGP